MKYRQGFVTNSSSTSYLIAHEKNSSTIELLEWMDKFINGNGYGSLEFYLSANLDDERIKEIQGYFKWLKQQFNEPYPVELDNAVESNMSISKVEIENWQDELKEYIYMAIDSDEKSKLISTDLE